MKEHEKCPYCQSELEKGILHAYHDNKLIWVPDKTSMRYSYYFSKKKIEKVGGFVLKSDFALNVLEQASMYCPKCKKLIISVNNDE